MSELFDPYHKWLGISPDEQPPNHYRLLGIAEFEHDSDVITIAADRQMAHVRKFQTGPHGLQTQVLLNELAAAKLVLLRPLKREAYDARLRARLALLPVAPRPSAETQLAPEAQPAAAPPAEPARPEPAAPVASAATDATSPNSEVQPARRWRRPWVVNVLVSSLAMVLVGALSLLLPRDEARPTPDGAPPEKAPAVPPVADGAPAAAAVNAPIVPEPVPPEPAPAVAPAVAVDPKAAVAPQQPPPVLAAANPPPAIAPKPFVPAADAPPPEDNIVDLLQHVSLARATSGQFRWLGQVLTSDSEEVPSRLPIDFAPPHDCYRVDLSVERMSGDGALELGLLVGKRQFFVGLGVEQSYVGETPGGTHSEADWKRPLFPYYQLTNVSVLVNSELLTVLVDGRVVIREFEHGALQRGDRFGDHQAGLMLGWSKGRYRVHQAKFRTYPADVKFAGPLRALDAWKFFSVPRVKPEVAAEKPVLWFEPDQRVKIPIRGLFPKGHIAMTAEAWIRLNPKIRSGILFGTYVNRRGITDPLGWQLRYRVVNANNVEFTLEQQVARNDQPNWTVAVGTSTEHSPEWHHVSLEIDENSTEVYWDGHRVRCNGIPFPIDDGPGVLYLGCGVNYSAGFGGAISQFKLSNAALHAALAHFEPPDKLAPDKSTVVLLDFTTVSGEVSEGLKGSANARLEGPAYFDDLLRFKAPTIVATRSSVQTPFDEPYLLRFGPLKDPVNVLAAINDSSERLAVKVGKQISLISPIYPETERYQVDLVVERARGIGPFFVGAPIQDRDLFLMMDVDGHAFIANAPDGNWYGSAEWRIPPLLLNRPTRVSVVVEQDLLSLQVEGCTVIDRFATNQLKPGWNWRNKESALLTFGSRFAAFEIPSVSYYPIESQRAIPIPLRNPLELRQQLPPAPPVDQVALQEKLRVVRDLVREESKHRDPKHLLDFLVREQTKTGNEALRYAVWKEVSRIAIDSGDWVSARHAVNAMCQIWQGDRFAQIADAMYKTSKNVSNAANLNLRAGNREMLGNDCIDSGREAAEAEEFDAAQRLIAIALNVGNLDEIPDLRKKASLCTAEVTRLVAERKAVDDALKTLQAMPDDPDANQIYGKYLCVSRGKWPEGLERIAKGAKPPLGELIQRDAAGPNTAAAQIALADALWDSAGTMDESMARLLKLRAAYWYDKAANLGSFDLRGSERSREAEKLSPFHR